MEERMKLPCESIEFMKFHGCPKASVFCGPTQLLNQRQLFCCVNSHIPRLILVKVKLSGSPVAY